MPRPRKPKPDPNEAAQQRDTPFRRVLIDFMWNRRAPTEPPMTQGQLAVRLGVPRTTLAAWLSGRITPPMDLVFDVLAHLGVPVQRLVDEYRAMGLPVPPLLEPDTGPTPRPYIPPAPPRDEWDEMIERVAADARDIGMDPETIAALVEHIRDRQRGHHPLDRYIRAEHQATSGEGHQATSGEGHQEGHQEGQQEQGQEQGQEQAREQPSSPPSQHQRRQRETKDERPRTHSRPR